MAEDPVRLVEEVRVAVALGEGLAVRLREEVAVRLAVPDGDPVQVRDGLPVPVPVGVAVAVGTGVGVAVAELVADLNMPGFGMQKKKMATGMKQNGQKKFSGAFAVPPAFF